MSQMWFEYAGNIHIHSDYSDGTSSIPKIARAAEEAGLDFIIITDHYNLAGLVEEGYYGNVHVMVGSEINRESHHYLGLNIKQVVQDNEDDPQMVIDAVNQQGGIGFVAHPFEKGSFIYEQGKTYPWTNWEVNGFTGLCVWNLLSEWRDGITSVAKALYLTYLNPHAALKKPNRETISKWDELLKQRMVVGIGCSDAHAIKLGWGPFRTVISDYYFCFRCINTHVILKQPLNGCYESDKALIYEALKEGRCFFSYDYFHNARGFRFIARNGGQDIHMGDEVSAMNTRFRVDTPKKAQVFLIKNGLRYRQSIGKTHIFRGLDPGVYRVEVYHHCRGYRAWIFSNPIYLR